MRRVGVRVVPVVVERLVVARVRVVPVVFAVVFPVVLLVVFFAAVARVVVRRTGFLASV